MPISSSVRRPGFDPSFVHQPAPADEAAYLQQQSFGQVLSNTFAIYLKHWSPVCLTLVLPLLPLAVLRAFLIAGGHMVLAVLVWLAQFGVAMLAGAALLVLISDVCVGQTPNVRRAFRQGFRNRSLFGTYLVTWLLIFAGFLLVVPGLVLVFRFMFVLPAIVLEDYRYRGAWRRSGELMRDYAWRNAGILVAVTLITYLPLFVLAMGGADAALMVVFGGLEGHLGLVTFFGDVASFLAYPLLSIPLILLYYDMRSRKEGFGAEQLWEELRF